jgi:hypothetical protein
VNHSYAVFRARRPVTSIHLQAGILSHDPQKSKVARSAHQPAYFMNEWVQIQDRSFIEFMTREQNTNCMKQNESEKYIVRSPCGRSLKLHLPVNIQLAVYLHSFASILR